MIISAKFLDAEGNPKGRGYTYGCNDTVAVGEIVYTAAGKKLVTTEIDLPESIGAEWGDKLGYLTTVDPSAETLQGEIVESTELITIPEITVNPLAVITVEQLPIITEQLKPLSAEIDNIIEQILALPCTTDTKSTIKKHRASLNGIFNNIEARRIAIKKQLDEPYDKFNAIYKDLITNKINTALNQLDERTGTIDTEIKNGLLTDIQDYFKEQALCEGVEWLRFEQANIKVGLSNNPTELRRNAKQFIDRVVGDIAMIDTQGEEAAEMHVEYRKTLNAALAIKTVKDRTAAVEREKARQAELAAARIAEDERRMAMAAPVTITPPVVETKQPEPFKPLQLIEPSKVYTMAFKATATESELKSVLKFMDANGIKYERIPLKNIMEVLAND